MAATEASVILGSATRQMPAASWLVGRAGAGTACVVMTSSDHRARSAPARVRTAAVVAFQRSVSAWGRATGGMVAVGVGMASVVVVMGATITRRVSLARRKDRS